MTDQPVPFLDLGATYRELKDELDEAYRRVMESGWYLLGGELGAFEHDFSVYVGAQSCAGVASGLDALILGLRALDVGAGDEVIVPSNTYIATWLAVSAVGARPVPVEPDPGTYNITADAIADAITARTAAVLPVHLYGLPADVHGIQALAERHGIPVLYDAAQAHGARVDEMSIGAFGDLVAWSFYPGKNLGGYADGGAVTSNRPDLIDRVRRLRNYGSDVKYLNLERGVNSRLDELQAAVLSVKLRHLDEWNERRRVIASQYLDGLASLDVILPSINHPDDSVWHLFVLQLEQRDAVQGALQQMGVQTLIHYPVPPSRQVAYADQEFPEQPIADHLAGHVLSLPIGPHQRIDATQRILAALSEILDPRPGHVG